MHLANVNFFIYASGRWPRYFEGGWVIEVGSANINGSIRSLFYNPTRYIGVDWRKDKGVDFISLAHKIPFAEESFDVVVSASMLEHDPYWDRSLNKMVDLMKPDGILILSWGCHGNPRHSAPEAPDYADAKRKGQHLALHHARPVGDVLRILEKRKLALQELRYEDDYQFNRHLYRGLLIPGSPDSKLATARGKERREYPLTAKNICNLVAFKNSELVTQPVIITKLRDGDLTC